MPTKLPAIVKSQQNEDLCALLTEIKSLKVAIRINKELEENLQRLLVSTFSFELKILFISDVASCFCSYAN
jgi:hypothetical protein